MKEIYTKYRCGDMSVLYLRDTEKDTVGLTLLPESLADQAVLEGWWNIEPAVQLKLVGDGYAQGFAQGHSMRNSVSTQSLRFREQRTEKKEEGLRVVTVLVDERVEARHYLEYRIGTDYLRMYSEVTALSDIGLEMLSSYNLCGFSCVGEGLRTQDFILHRMQSKWSMEGRLESENFPDLNLEPSWLRIGAGSLRFGQVGSMPVRRYFTWMVAEDRAFGYSIGLQLCHPGSWQMEVYNIDERISLSGGLADREFGHWVKKLKKGEVFRTPEVIATVAKEDVDGISHRLVQAQEENLLKASEVERALPVIFNEYCTSWGTPSEEEMLSLIESLKGHHIRYCVMDAGWFVKKGQDWSSIGDWEVNEELFHHGLRFLADEIRRVGMIPGIWFEMENAGAGSKTFGKEEWLLTRDGYPLQVGARRFLDFRKKEVQDYLTERVIEQLRGWDMGYLKVDYNDNIGIGCDGAESQGEGLRQHLEGVQAFWKKLRRELPELVIENCSSGGHRLEPSMQALAAMASFSDAHECEIIPILAANVTRAILPAQSQIWAVLRRKDSEKRLYYSLCNTFLGRMCLSGDVRELEDWQWKVVDEAIRCYEQCAPIIRSGRNYRQGPRVTDYNHPAGWQAVCRVNRGRGQILAVFHSFYDSKTETKIRLPAWEGEAWEIREAFHRNGITERLEENSLTVEGVQNFDAAVWLLQKKTGKTEK